ncbi:histone H2A deubiquitinase MYSM1-like [Octopus vulgaris]|uniref:Myb-like, SWIRM and MPN domain-containing protein 1 n=1 Tax=Octopus vulgaris TaxID=6645 RepID=A0AA36BS64_OCTVU|nr:histone H2A deubiquitinase MYSM1-like [Octopus vulgaris]
MADDVEIDVEGDFDFKLEPNGIIAYDVNELPSKSANLLPEYTNPPWMLEQGWTLDSCMDEKSKATIEKMLQEEQYYMNGKGVAKMIHEKSPKTPVKRKPVTNKKLWTVDEKKLFQQGLELYGRSWKKIALLIPERTSLQVKNYAQHYFKNMLKQKPNVSEKPISLLQHNSIKDPLSTTLASVTTAQPTVYTVNTKRKKPPSHQNGMVSPPCSVVVNSMDLISVNSDKMNISITNLDVLTPLDQNKATLNSESEDEDIDVDIESVDNLENNQVLNNRSASPNSVYFALLKSANIKKQNCAKVKKKLPPSNPVCINVAQTCVNGNSLVKPDPVVSLAQPCPQPVDNDAAPGPEIDCDTDMTKNPQDEELASPAVDETEEMDNFDSLSEDKAIPCIVPSEEVVLDYEHISEEEKKAFPEFFDGRLSKTPQRYLKIRNYMLDCWKACKPSFLNKTSVRPGLKNCGDVNCIGKIHTYIEGIGAINFGCEQAFYNQLPKSSTSTTKKTCASEEVQDQQASKLDAMRPRRKRVKDDEGFWVCDTIFKDKTAENKECNKASQPKMSRTKLIEDPFRLIPCQMFPEEMAPLHIDIESSALITMDVHAHMFKTEVVGLLGGECSPEGNHMKIKTAMPCRSISTGIQCEMDAVSQTEVGTVITELGQSVVGWYHSHPTFAANPSTRDIESQLKYQEWFARGGSKYVAFIVSPYMGKVHSEMCCLTVEKSMEPDLKHVPFKHTYQELNNVLDMEKCLDIIEQLLSDQHSQMENKIDLNKLYDHSTEVTCLSKMVMSIGSYISKDHPQRQQFLEAVEKCFEKSPQLQEDSLQFNADLSKEK